MTKDELIDFLQKKLVITIDRDAGYYSYPSLEVKIELEGVLITSSSCTIYDGDRND